MTGSSVMKETGRRWAELQEPPSSFCPSLGPIDYTNNRLKVSNCYGLFFFFAWAVKHAIILHHQARLPLKPQIFQIPYLKTLSVYCNRQLEAIKVAHLIHYMTSGFRQIHLACNIFIGFSVTFPPKAKETDCGPETRLGLKDWPCW